MTRYAYSAAFLAVFLLSLSNIFARYSVLTFSASPPVYSAFTVLVAALTLLIVAGPGDAGLATLRSLHTWLYGVLQVLFGISEVYAYSSATTIEGTTLLRFTIVFTMFASWFILGRRPLWTDILGSAIVFCALAHVAWTLPPTSRPITLFAILVASLFLTLRTVIAETHPTSVRALTAREQCRVTGIVLLVTANPGRR